MTDAYYEKIKAKNIGIYTLLQWHFEKTLKSIHRNITTRESLRRPWAIEVKREVQFKLFYEFFKAIDFYRTAFGRTIKVEKDKKGYIKTIEIKFIHYEAFILHIHEISALTKGEIKNYFKKSFKGEITGKVVITEDKPCFILYKKSTETMTWQLHYEICNRYGINVC